MLGRRGLDKSQILGAFAVTPTLYEEGWNADGEVGQIRDGVQYCGTRQCRGQRYGEELIQRVTKEKMIAADTTWRRHDNADRRDRHHDYARPASEMPGGAMETEGGE